MFIRSGWFSESSPRERAIRDARRRMTAAEQAIVRARAALDAAEQDRAAAEAVLAHLTGGAR